MESKVREIVEKKFILAIILLVALILAIFATKLTFAITIQPNSLVITLTDFNRNMTFGVMTYEFENITVYTNMTTFSNYSMNSLIDFNSTFSFNNMNITLVNWTLSNNNATVQIVGSTSPNFLYFDIARNDSSSCFINQTNLADGYVNAYCKGRLETDLVSPPTPTSILQNNTFLVNATVYCRDSDCGNVYGTVMYNLSTAYPDTTVNTTQGNKPFYIQENPALALKGCPSNPLVKNEFCNITWTVNASGAINTDWKIGAFFNSSFNNVLTNTTPNATVSIVPCTIDFSIWSNINFGVLNPSTNNQSAVGNPTYLYNITTNAGSCNNDFYINGTDLQNVTYSSRILVGNVSWSNISSDINSGFFSLSSSKVSVKLNIPQKTNITTWYWINVPPVYAGIYNGTVTITGVKNGLSP
jgi:hypothetical protein